MRHRKSGDAFIIRLEKGDELFASLLPFIEKKRIRAGYFNAIGAVRKVTLGFYHLGKKEYSWRSFEECEVVALTGNIAILKGKPLIHAHGVFSDKAFVCCGGHIKEAIAQPTMEIILTPLPGKIERKFSNEMGLNLMNL